MSDHDVVVVGAGPGGCAAALGLARAGLRVALLDRDRFPRDKVCGDAITPLGVKLLAQLGLLDDIRAIADAETRGIRVAIGRAPANELSTPLLVVRRTVLDAALVDAVRPLVDVVEQVAVTELVLAGDAVCGVIARDAQGKSVTLRASVVIGADGATSTVARLAGAQTNLREHRLLASRAYFSGVRLDDDEPEFHFLPELGGGYLWIFPAGPDRYNVGLGATTEHLTHAARTPKAWLEHLIASESFHRQFASATRLTPFGGGQIPCGGIKQALSGAGYVLIGDAAGLSDAFWGDGIDTALVSGTLAAAHIAAALRGAGPSAATLASYDQAVRRALGPKLVSAIERQHATRGALAQTAT